MVAYIMSISATSLLQLQECLSVINQVFAYQNSDLTADSHCAVSVVGGRAVLLCEGGVYHRVWDIFSPVRPPDKFPLVTTT